MKRLCHFLIVALTLIPACAEGVDTEVHEYVDKTGEITQQILWRLEKGDAFTLTWQTPEETHITTLSPDLGTVRWEMHNPEKRTDIIAERKGETLLIRGTMEGKKMDERVAIDDSPWYQATSLSLRSFVQSEKKTREFWTIRPDELSVHKIQAKKLEKETLMVAQSETTVRKVKLSLPGLGAALWKCFYWFIEDSGVWVRYEGPTGPPGWPKKVILLNEGQTI